jgi:hypothetical protein
MTIPAAKKSSTVWLQTIVLLRLQQPKKGANLVSTPLSSAQCLLEKLM